MEIQKITPKIEHSKQRSQIFSNNINGAGTNVAQTSFTGAADTLYSIPAVFLRFLDTNQAWGLTTHLWVYTELQLAHS